MVKGKDRTLTRLNLPAITDVSRDSISGGGGSVCGSDIGGVVGAAAMKKAMDNVSSA